MAAPPTPAPPLPPQVEAQASQPQMQSLFSAQGVPQEQPGMQTVQGISGTLDQLEQMLKGLMAQLEHFDPNLKAFLVPMANAGGIWKNAIDQLRQALSKNTQQSGMATGSPEVPQQPPMNPGAPPPNPNAI